jgi:hypothetical protein
METEDTTREISRIRRYINNDLTRFLRRFGSSIDPTPCTYLYCCLAVT